MSYSEPTPTAGGLFARFGRWLAFLEDGPILKAAFVAMLGGAAGMLVLDYFELFSAPQATLSVPVGQMPVLPAVERPELDKTDPAYNPPARFTGDLAMLNQAMRFTLTGGGVLRAEGQIVAGSAQALADEITLRSEYIKMISLNSPGGAVDEALALAAEIRAAGFDTLVQDGDVCASSCPLVLASGVNRLVGNKALVGVHQAFASTMPVGTAQALSDMQVKTAMISRQLISMGVDAGLWLHALETPPDRLYYLRPQEMLELRLATAILMPDTAAR